MGALRYHFIFHFFLLYLQLWLGSGLHLHLLRRPRLFLLSLLLDATWILWLFLPLARITDQARAFHLLSLLIAPLSAELYLLLVPIAGLATPAAAALAGLVGLLVLDVTILLGLGELGGLALILHALVVYDAANFLALDRLVEATAPCLPRGIDLFGAGALV